MNGPPTKRKVIETPEPLGDDTDADVQVGSDYRPRSADNESNRFATPSSKKKRGRPGSARKCGITKRRLPRASSEPTQTARHGGA